MWGPIQNFGPIGSAVLTFIGYKQTDKQSIYLDCKDWPCGDSWYIPCQPEVWCNQQQWMEYGTLFSLSQECNLWSIHENIGGDKNFKFFAMFFNADPNQGRASKNVYFFILIFILILRLNLYLTLEIRPDIWICLFGNPDVGSKKCRYPDQKSMFFLLPTYSIDFLNCL